MKATRKTIPTLIEQRKKFSNGSATLSGHIDPSQDYIEDLLSLDGLDDIEKSRFRIDADTNGIAYLVVSYSTPIAWETSNGYVYKVSQTLTQTTENHKGLLYLFHQVDTPVD